METRTGRHRQRQIDRNEGLASRRIAEEHGKAFRFDKIGHQIDQISRRRAGLAELRQKNRSNENSPFVAAALRLCLSP